MPSLVGSEMCIRDSNNNPAMVVEIEAKNLCLVVPGSLDNNTKKSANQETEEDVKCLGLVLDVFYKHQWAGDNWYGPGEVTITIDAILRYGYIFPMNHVLPRKSLKPFQSSQVQQDFSGLENISNLVENSQPKKIYKEDKKAVTKENCINIIEPFKVQFVKGYKVSFYRPPDKQPPKDKFSQALMIVNIFNSQSLQNNFNISVIQAMNLSEIIKVIQQPTSEVVPPYQFQRKDPRPPDLEDYWKSQKIVQIDKFRIKMQKNSFGQQLLQVELNNIYMKFSQEIEKSNLQAIGSIGVNYYNNRKCGIEPFIEPFAFEVKLLNQGNNSELVFQDYRDPSQENQAEFIKLHQNSFNINLSMPFIESLLEAKALSQKPSQDTKAYILQNKTGYILEISNSHHSFQKKATDKFYLLNNNLMWDGWDPHGKKNMNQFDLTILKGEYLDSYYQQQQVQVQQQQQPGQPLLISEISSKLVSSEYFTNSVDTTETQKIDLKLQRHPSKFVLQIQKKNEHQVLQNFMKQEIERHLLKEIENNQTESQYLGQSKMSNYKALKKIVYDQVGKHVLILDPINKDDFSKSNQKKDINKASFLGINIGQKVINEEFKDFLIVTTSLDQTSVSKKVVISSSVRIINELNKSINIFMKADNIIQDQSFTVKSKETFHIPLNYLLEQNTQIAFSFEKEEKLMNLDYKYYNLGSLIHDQQPLSDFEVNDIERYQQLLLENLNQQIDKKQILLYKSDQNIQICETSEQNKSQLKQSASQIDYHFSMQCIKNLLNIEINSKKVPCYETILVINPQLEILNALPRKIKLSIIPENKQGVAEVYPGKLYQFALNQLKPQSLKIALEQFQDQMIPLSHVAAKKRQTIEIRFTQIDKQKSGQLYLFLEIIKRSNSSTCATIYCPFLVYNQSGYNLRFRQNDSTGIFLACEDIPPNAIVQCSSQVDQRGEKGIVSKKPLQKELNNNEAHDENDKAFNQLQYFSLLSPSSKAVSYTHLTLPTICSVQISVVAVSLKKKKKKKQ
eukprot:TRINITY_DN5224_c0_g1_i4.p1 TRINITY_DN5224_c0_g1~~TRINITY_DN5224_c0_g1_i4.p1  ORF type:complete len:1016 (-),score=210.06 TRINITY_DN5224_c0_g1_i4:90-3137(-)